MVLDAGDTVAEVGRMDGFAGVYMDHDRDGRLVFQFSKGVQAAEQAIAASMPSDVDFGVRKVDYSLEELDAVGEDLLSRADRLLDQDIQLVSLRYDIQNNRIVAGVDGSTTRAENVFENVSGSFIVEADEAGVLDACNDVTDCPPGKGGIRINDGKFCTSAVVGKRTDGSAHRVLITAGHCLQRQRRRDLDAQGRGGRDGRGEDLAAEFQPTLSHRPQRYRHHRPRRRLPACVGQQQQVHLHERWNRLPLRGPPQPRSPVRRSAPSVRAARTSQVGRPNGAGRSRPTTRSV
jgi:hypothetical protein